MVPKRLSHNVYVVLLRPEVLFNEKKFRDQNPLFVPGSACLYVGMTGLTPEQRFDRHKNKNQFNKYVLKYGERLALEFLEKPNPMTYEEAKAEEPRLAEALRELGHAVWQN